MKQSLILLLLLVLAACTPAPGHHLVTTEASAIETSGGLMVTPIREDIATIERYWPSFQTWDRCVINGQTYENVSFVYTDLGLGYQIGDVLEYRSDMEVTSCITKITS